MKKVKILTITLSIILIAMIAFGGIYIKYQNRMENKVKDFSYAMNLKGARNIRLKLKTGNKTIVKDSSGNEVKNSSNLTDEEIAEKGYVKEEQAYNNDEEKNVDNYKKAKKIIENRLKELDIENYITKIDEQTGDILIEIPEDDKTDSTISGLNTVGKFEIIDSETKEVLMTNSDIKKAEVLYGSGSTSTTTSSGTTVYLSIEFNKEGSKKLEDISTKYVKSDENTTNTDNSNDTTNETEETNKTDSNSSSTEEKKITMKIDDEEIMSTSFDETLKTGKLQLSIGKASTDKKTVQGYAEQAKNMAVVLDTGNLPLTYEVDGNEYIISDININTIQIFIYAVIAIIAIALIIMIIKFKLLGLLGTVSYIGFAAVFSLLLKYANVAISFEGLFGILLTLILNYIFVYSFISKIKEVNVSKANKETNKEFLIKIIPIIIMVITFCFIKWEPISSFGMIMFWGILLIFIYNIVITNSLLKIKLNNKLGGKESNEENK